MHPFKKPSLPLIILILVTGLALSACGGGSPTPAPCSVAWLVAEINAANASPNAPGTHDTIDLDPGCVYQIDSPDNDTDGYNGLPSITSPIQINGHAATISRSPNKEALRLLHVAPGASLILLDLTLFNGAGMEPVDVTEPTRNAGGAIYNAGSLTLTDVVITGNLAGLRGAGIYNASTGVMNIHTTTIDDNAAELLSVTGQNGGGIYNDGYAAIYQSTISNNTATGAGAGIYNAGEMILTNDTLSGNQSPVAPGIRNVGTMSILFNTITDNSPAPALFSSLSTLEITSSIIANNPGGDCQYPGGVAILGQNLDSDGSCTGFTITANPLLGPLANNGGNTMTHALLPSSPAIDFSPDPCAPEYVYTDQRGVSRPQGPRCDLGSYEDDSGFTGPIGIATLHITPFFPLYTPTPTIGRIPPFGRVLREILCWVGPGDPYDVISSIQPETQVELLGTGEGGGYLVILNPRYGVPCWTRENDVDTGEVDLLNLPIFKIPPLPTPTPTPVPQVGCWVSAGQTTGPRCVVPCPDPKRYPQTCTP